MVAFWLIYNFKYLLHYLSLYYVIYYHRYSKGQSQGLHSLPYPQFYYLAGIERLDGGGDDGLRGQAVGSGAIDFIRRGAAGYLFEKGVDTRFERVVEIAVPAEHRVGVDGLDQHRRWLPATCHR